jgi:hypothetical protein
MPKVTSGADGVAGGPKLDQPVEAGQKGSRVVIQVVR